MLFLLISSLVHVCFGSAVLPNTLPEVFSSQPHIDHESPLVTTDGIELLNELDPEILDILNSLYDDDHFLQDEDVDVVASILEGNLQGHVHDVPEHAVHPIAAHFEHAPAIDHPTTVPHVTDHVAPEVDQNLERPAQRRRIEHSQIENHPISHQIESVSEHQVHLPRDHASNLALDHNSAIVHQTPMELLPNQVSSIVEEGVELAERGMLGASHHI